MHHRLLLRLIGCGAVREKNQVFLLLSEQRKKRFDKKKKKKKNSKKKQKQKNYDILWEIIFDFIAGFEIIFIQIHIYFEREISLRRIYCIYMSVPFFFFKA